MLRLPVAMVRQAVLRKASGPLDAPYETDSWSSGLLEDDLPRPHRPGEEDAGRVEWVGLQDRLGGLLGVGLVDDEGPAAVGVRAGREQFSLFEQARQVRPVGLDDRRILQVFD